MRLLGHRHCLDGFGGADRVRVLAGHHLGCSLERRFRGRELRRVVLLRDPVSLQLSLYNYRMMNHLNKGLGTYSFDLHVQAQPRDWIAHWLLGRWLEIPWPRLMMMSDAEKYGILNRMLAGFWYVGSHSSCDRLIAALAADLGIPPRARARNTARQWQQQIYWEPLTAEALSPETRDALVTRNPIDAAIWESWQSAGFDTAATRPRPLGRSAAYRFLAHEAARPIFLTARWFRCRWGPRLRLGRAKSGLRSGFAKADLARDAGEWRRAADLYRRGLAEEPRAPAIWVQYGHMLKMCGEIAAAETAYRQSLRYDPENADTHLQLGRALAMQKRAGEAADAYRHALALDPQLEEAVAALRSVGAAADARSNVPIGRA
jgi:hypothetical protein